MSTKGSGRRLLNRDADKERANWDAITKDSRKKSSGRRVKAPNGVSERIVYGAKPVDYSNKYE